MCRKKKKWKTWLNVKAFGDENKLKIFRCSGFLGSLFGSNHRTLGPCLYVPFVSLGLRWDFQKKKIFKFIKSNINKFGQRWKKKYGFSIETIFPLRTEPVMCLFFSIFFENRRKIGIVVVFFFLEINRKL